MSVLAAVRAGLPALLVVHALRTLCALLMIGPLYGELARGLQTSVFTARATPGDAALALELFARSAPAALPGAVVWLVAYALLGPWLQQWMLLALGGSELRAALLAALRRYPAALAVRATAVGSVALAVVIALLALDAALDWLPASAPLELGGRALCFLALGMGGFWLASAHDLAQASIAHGQRVRHVGRAAARTCTRGALVRHALALAAAAALVLLAELAGRVPLAVPYATGPMAVLVVQQTLLFAALLVRAAWLGHALERTRTLSPPRP